MLTDDPSLQLQTQGGGHRQGAFTNKVQHFAGVGHQLSVPVWDIDRVCELSFGTAGAPVVVGIDRGCRRVPEVAGAETRNQDVAGEAKP